MPERSTPPSPSAPMRSRLRAALVSASAGAISAVQVALALVIALAFAGCVAACVAATVPMLLALVLLVARGRKRRRPKSAEGLGDEPASLLRLDDPRAWKVFRP